MEKPWLTIAYKIELQSESHKFIIQINDPNIKSMVGSRIKLSNQSDEFDRWITLNQDPRIKLNAQSDESDRWTTPIQSSDI